MARTKKTARKSTGGRPPRRDPKTKKSPDHIAKMEEFGNLELALDDWLDGNYSYDDWGGKIQYLEDTKSWAVSIDFTEAIKNLRARLSEKFGEGRVCLRASLYTSSKSFEEQEGGEKNADGKESGKESNEEKADGKESKEEAENEGQAK